MATKKFTRRGSSARNSSPLKSARRRLSAKAEAKVDQPDLPAILGNFADARAVIETACRSLENADDYSEAASALRTGLRMFNNAYNNLDRAIGRH